MQKTIVQTLRRNPQNACTFTGRKPICKKQLFSAYRSGKMRSHPTEQKTMKYEKALAIADQKNAARPNGAVNGFFPHEIVTRDATKSTWVVMEEDEPNGLLRVVEAEVRCQLEPMI
jgi:hypothetical protein